MKEERWALVPCRCTRCKTDIPDDTRVGCVLLSDCDISTDADGRRLVLCVDCGLGFVRWFQPKRGRDDTVQIEVELLRALNDSDTLATPEAREMNAKLKAIVQEIFK